MAEGPAQKPVTALEPVLLFIGAVALGGIVLRALVTGWVWIPGDKSGGGQGAWLSRTDDLNSYLIFVVIAGVATLASLGMAIGSLRRFNARTRQGKR